MDSNSSKAPKRGSILRTTTWGALIASSILVAAFGFQARFVSDADQMGSNRPLLRRVLPVLGVHTKSQSNTAPKKASDDAVSLAAESTPARPAGTAPAGPVGPSSTVWGAHVTPNSRPQLNSQPTSPSSG